LDHFRPPFSGFRPSTLLRAARAWSRGRVPVSPCCFMGALRAEFSHPPPILQPVPTPEACPQSLRGLSRPLGIPARSPRLPFGVGAGIERFPPACHGVVPERRDEAGPRGLPLRRPLSGFRVLCSPNPPLRALPRRAGVEGCAISTPNARKKSY